MATEPTVWERIEAGWYVSDIGGICYEGNGWYFYPAGRENYTYFREGPYRTLREAKEKHGDGD